VANLTLDRILCDRGELSRKVKTQFRLNSPCYRFAKPGVLVPISHLTRPFRSSSFTVGNLPDRYAPKAIAHLEWAMGTTVHCICMLRGATAPGSPGIDFPPPAYHWTCQVPRVRCRPYGLARNSSSTRQLLDQNRVNPLAPFPCTRLSRAPTTMEPPTLLCFIGTAPST